MKNPNFFVDINLSLFIRAKYKIPITIEMNGKYTEVIQKNMKIIYTPVLGTCVRPCYINIRDVVSFLANFPLKLLTFDYGKRELCFDEYIRWGRISYDGLKNES